MPEQERQSTTNVLPEHGFLLRTLPFSCSGTRGETVSLRRTEVPYALAEYTIVYRCCQAIYCTRSKREEMALPPLAEARGYPRRVVMNMFPTVRMRRLRQNEKLRSMVRETRLSVDQLIYPLFIAEGIREPREISSMPGIFQWPLEHVGREAERIAGLGIPAVLLFGIPAEKDEVGSQAYAEQGIIQQAIRRLKSVTPDTLVITDVCLCEYTSHGHCGVIQHGSVQNDESLELLARMALSHAEAGADIVAPSDMMDGRVGLIRHVLDENGLNQTPIMAYSAKFASAFYGPFREAAESA